VSVEKLGLHSTSVPGVAVLHCPCGFKPEINLRDLGQKFVRCFRCGAEYDRLGFVMTASQWAAPEWDEVGAIRERLWLLAHFGPVALKPAEWRYNPKRDDWAFVGRDFTLAGARVRVTHEGSVSLAKLERAWHVPRGDAMRLIGYPET
jgi:hypothetical protein